jgi:DNA ligase (NAD+)
MNIDGMGEKVIDALLEAQLIDELADIFKLSRNDLLLLPFFKEKKSDKLIEAIEAVKKVSLERFLFALGIRQVGEETAIALAEYFQDQWLEMDKEGAEGLHSINQLLILAQAMDADKLEEVEGFGKKVSEEILEWFKLESNINSLKNLAETGVTFVNEGKPMSLKLKGMSFVITGTLKSMSRDQAKERIRQNGGKVVNSVTKKTSFVIMGEQEKASTKGRDAKKHGVKMIEEDEFLKMIEL